ncbi:MAG: type II toxin-antitoxin system RelE/ParE family toxin [Actinomycetota bacterium]|nr:type II toxin-antitoxin system RelE/ParE family toxin [Actinomycetota bacterium]MDI6822727.1 type II toxin-antitoxin system RelE/ParE family toxin [Actinomycetota bacterium]
MPFEIEISKGALKNLKKLDRKTINQLKKAIDEMVEDPLQGDVVKLRGYEAFRKRVGDFRIIFAVSFSDSRVFIMDILPRGEAYKKL